MNEEKDKINLSNEDKDYINDYMNHSHGSMEEDLSLEDELINEIKRGLESNILGNPDPSTTTYNKPNTTNNIPNNDFNITKARSVSDLGDNNNNNNLNLNTEVFQPFSAKKESRFFKSKNNNDNSADNDPDNDEDNHMMSIKNLNLNLKPNNSSEIVNHNHNCLRSNLNIMNNTNNMNNYPTNNKFLSINQNMSGPNSNSNLLNMNPTTNTNNNISINNNLIPIKKSVSANLQQVSNMTISHTGNQPSNNNNNNLSYNNTPRTHNSPITSTTNISNNVSHNVSHNVSNNIFNNVSNKISSNSNSANNLSNVNSNNIEINSNLNTNNPNNSNNPNNTNNPNNPSFITTELDFILEFANKHDKIIEDSHKKIKSNYLKLLVTQNGSRILQKLILLTESSILSDIFIELKVSLTILMVHNYANYFCQKFYSVLNIEEKQEYIEYISKEIYSIGISKVGTFPFQSIIDLFTTQKERQVICEAIKRISSENLVKMSHVSV